MERCDWCKRKTDNITMYTDALKNVYNICEKCDATVKSNHCRKCGTDVDPDFIINGLCTNCVQADAYAKAKSQEEALSGVESSEYVSDSVFTDDDFEHWMLLSKSFSYDDMKKSQELQYIWVTVKLNAAGIYDQQIISDNMSSIRKLLDANLSKLRGRKCRLVIDCSPKIKDLIHTSTIIAQDGMVYILAV